MNEAPLEIVSRRERAAQRALQPERIAVLVEREKTRIIRWYERRRSGWSLVGFRLRIDGRWYANGARRWKEGRQHGYIFPARSLDEESQDHPSANTGRMFARGHKLSLYGILPSGELSPEDLLTAAASIGLRLLFDERAPGSGVIDIVSVWCRKRKR